jgi:dTDP-glucose pyrophosphorylase
MAGLGTRFSHAGYKKIKPLIKVLDKSMIEIVLDNLIPHKSKIDKVILIINREINQDDQFKTLIKNYKQKIELRVLNNVSRGPADSVYMARDLILLDEPVTIANCDQYLFTDMKQFYQNLSEPDKDGIIITMQDNHPKWSYAAIDPETNLVTSVVEKKVISTYATVGVYGFRKARDLIEAIEESFRKGETVNNEYYVGPMYNYLIAKNSKIHIYNLGELGIKFFGLGTPDDLKIFQDYVNNEKIKL